jgi:hypothetical protein
MSSRDSSYFYIFPANHHFSRVEPRGFEPLTSAVQRRRDDFPSVRQCSKNGLFERNALSPLFPLFTNVCPGNCRVTVRYPSGYGSCSRHMRVEARLACCSEQYLLLL